MLLALVHFYSTIVFGLEATLFTLCVLLKIFLTHKGTSDASPDTLSSVVSTGGRFDDSLGASLEGVSLEDVFFFSVQSWEGYSSSQQC